MRLASNQIYDRLEKDFSKSLIEIFSIMEFEFFKLTDDLLTLPIEDYGIKSIQLLDFIMGDPIAKQFELIPSIFRVFQRNLTGVMNTSFEAMDKANGQNLFSGRLMEEINKKSAHFRRWKIIVS